MNVQRKGVANRFAGAVALTGGAADNQQNVVRNTANKATVSAAAASPTSTVGDAGTNFLTQIGTALSNAQTQVGTAGTNAISQTGTAVSNGQTQVGTAGTNAISQTGTAVSNGQTQVGTAGTNALTQLGGAGNGLLNGIGNLFNRG
jgi:hypothetical protein